jgi:LysR family transcriptional regulator, mexEF-oprN operon transcriptional activator
MTGLNLRNIDLNLLVAFDALMIEGHVSRAGARIGVSQPAMSRFLKTLRGMFSDQLFIRTIDGMTPTPKALELARQIGPGLEIISAAIGMRDDFRPAQARRRFQLAMSDLASYLELPTIMRIIRERSPYSEVTVVNAGNREILDMVEAGKVEFGFGTFDHLPDRLRSANLAALREVAIADPRNRLVAGKDMTLDLFLALPHVAVWMHGDNGTPLDVILETLGQERHVALTVPNFLPVPRTVLGTDMIAVVVEDMLDRLPEANLLARYDIPLPLDPVMGRMVWHRRFDEDAGHRWFREAVAKRISHHSGRRHSPSFASTRTP